MAFLSSLVGTITGKCCGGDRILIREGIYSFNSTLCGITAILFLHGDKRWFIALFAAGLAALSMKMLSKVLEGAFVSWLTAYLMGVDSHSLDCGESSLQSKNKENTAYRDYCRNVDRASNRRVRAATRSVWIARFNFPLRSLHLVIYRSKKILPENLILVIKIFNFHTFLPN